MFSADATLVHISGSDGAVWDGGGPSGGRGEELSGVWRYRWTRNG